MNAVPDFPPLDRASPLPLFFQLRERLLTMVAHWEDPRLRFPTDEEISAAYVVSRTTVRQAVSSLVSEGLLKRIRGRGTFVARRLEERLEPGMNIRGQWSASFLPMDVEVLDFSRRPATSEEARLLGLREGEEIVAVRRLRKAGGLPIALDQRIIPGALAAGWTAQNAQGSMLHQLWAQRPLQAGDLTLEAAPGSAEECALLQLRPGAPVMVRHLVYEDEEGCKVMAGRSVHRADLMRYRVRIPLARDGNARDETPHSVSIERRPVVKED